MSWEADARYYNTACGSLLSVGMDKTRQICEINQLFEMSQDNQINSSEEKSENRRWLSES